MSLLFTSFHADSWQPLKKVAFSRHRNYKNMTRKRYSKSPYFVYYLHPNIISRETTCDSNVLRGMGFARQPHNEHYATKSKASGFRWPLACVSEPAHPNYTRNVRTSISRRSRKSLTRFSYCRCYLLSSFMLSKRI